MKPKTKNMKAYFLYIVGGLLVIFGATGFNPAGQGGAPDASIQVLRDQNQKGEKMAGTCWEAEITQSMVTITGGGSIAAPGTAPLGRLVVYDDGKLVHLGGHLNFTTSGTVQYIDISWNGLWGFSPAFGSFFNAVFYDVAGASDDIGFAQLIANTKSVRLLRSISTGPVYFNSQDYVCEWHTSFCYGRVVGT